MPHVLGAGDESGESRLGERRLRLIARGDGPAPPVSRLAAILAADIVEYTRHMAEDEIGTHARFSAIFQEIAPLIAHEGGRIVKSTGDGFLAEFGSATRATWFGVAFQHAVRARNGRRRAGARIEFRVGINLGDVIVEAHDVFGHAINVAARLESLAEPGGVLVSQAVFVAIRDPGLRFEDKGELPLRNMHETVRAFRVRPTAMRGRAGRWNDV